MHSGTSKSPDSEERGAFFGRRKGKALRRGQARLIETLLPQLAIDLSQPAPAELSSLFPVPVDQTRLEIGFGGGEHLIAQALDNPRCGFIGVEPFLNGMAKALIAIEANGLRNVRLHHADATALLAWLPPASLDRVDLLYPDPWPKRKHQKRRLVNPATLDMLARVMRSGAELRFGTDIGDYARSALTAFAAEPRFVWQADGPADWRVRPGDWPETRYEAKAVREGRRRYYFRFRRV